MYSSAFSVHVRPLRPIRALATVAITLIALVSIVAVGLSGLRILYEGDRLWRLVYEWEALYTLLLSPIVLLFPILYLLAGIAFVCWLFRARANAYAISPGVFHTYAAPYLVLGWVLPIVNLFAPKGIVDDILATSRPGGLRPGSDLFRARRSGLVWAWWLTWVLWPYATLASVGLAGTDMEDMESALESGLADLALITGIALPIAAGLLAIRVVLTITDLQETARVKGPVRLPERGPVGKPHLGLTALVVRDYDEAIAFYVDVLGFELLEDTPQGEGGRWVTVRPRGARETALLLARADGLEQEARVGDQTGGRVGLFLHTDDFARDHERMLAAGVTFEETPRQEPYGTVAVFLDLYGNRWDLLQPRVSPAYG